MSPTIVVQLCHAYAFERRGLTFDVSVCGVRAGAVVQGGDQVAAENLMWGMNVHLQMCRRA
eukprot:17220-Eustigmatos_ZCMA.PRE.1